MRSTTWRREVPGIDATSRACQRIARAGEGRRLHRRASSKPFGLKPLDGKSYFQAFHVTTSAKLGKNNRFEYTQNGQTDRA